jgi:hypothetical protein
MDRMCSILSTSSAGLPPGAIGCPKAWLPILVAGAAFLIDINTPDGVADGFLYVAAVLVCVSHRSPCPASRDTASASVSAWEGDATARRGIRSALATMRPGF